MAVSACKGANKLPRSLHRRSAILLSLIVGVVLYLEMAGKVEEKSDIGGETTEPVLGDKKLPGCIIIGVRKGGTRALLEMLSLHPSIRMAAQEVHFFDNETNYARGYSWYLSQMPNLGPDQIAVEKSPSYLVTPGVAERVRAMDPAVHLLLIVREPVTRLVSDFTQITFNRLEKGLQTRTFDETIIRPDGSVNVDYYGVDTGLYSSHLERWYQYFPREQIHVVNGDRLIKTPWREISKIEQFLGLEAKVTQENFYFNTTKGFHCLRPGQGSERCLAKSKGRPHVNVSKQSVTLLRKFYMPHNLRFYNLVGKDFGWPED